MKRSHEEIARILDATKIVLDEATRSGYVGLVNNLLNLRNDLYNERDQKDVDPV